MIMKNGYAVWRILVLVLIGGAMWVSPQAFAETLVPYENFITTGEAKISDDSVIQLTDKRTFISGGYWSQSSVDMTGVLEIEFEFCMSDGIGLPDLGKGADGIMVNFAPTLPQTSGLGEEMGFYGKGAWGIEFDTWYNDHRGDMKGNHIAVIQDSVDNHLKMVDGGESNDGKWHTVKINYENNTVAVYYDGKLVLDYSGVHKFDSAYIGITAATGSYVQNHLIKNVKVSVPEDESLLGCNVELSALLLTFAVSFLALLLRRPAMKKRN